MPYVPNEILRKFNSALEGAIVRLGNGRISISVDKLREIVKAHREAAVRYVELQIQMAASQPGYLQPAIMVANALQMEFGDKGPLDQISARAEELGVTLQEVGPQYVPPAGANRLELVARKRAQDWWASNPGREACCDHCRKVMSAPQGFLIYGRRSWIGAQEINHGEELLCEACYREIIR